MGETRSEGAPSRAEIDLGALRRNLAAVRARGRGRRVIAVVKADAYGHGAVTVARALEADGAEMLAVATPSEARELRVGRIRAPLLLLQGIRDRSDADAVLELDLVPLVGSIASLPILESAAASVRRRVPVHLKFDTGMGRLGLQTGETSAALDRLRASPHLLMDGASTHLAEADDPDSLVTDAQRRAFGSVLELLRSAGADPEWVHADNSAGVLRGPTPGTNAVRPGLLLYGPDPTLEGGGGLEPVMSVITRVIHAKTVPAGARVGYGGTWVAPRSTRILTIPFGYADGLPRSLAAGFPVGLCGGRVPLVGRVSMDLATIDAGPTSAADVGDEVLLFGRSGDLSIRAEELAAAAGTIAYEILVRIGRRVTRVPRDG